MYTRALVRFKTRSTNGVPHSTVGLGPTFPCHDACNVCKTRAVEPTKAAKDTLARRPALRIPRKLPIGPSASLSFPVGVSGLSVSSLEPAFSQPLLVDSYVMAPLSRTPIGCSRRPQRHGQGRHFG